MPRSDLTVYFLSCMLSFHSRLLSLDEQICFKNLKARWMEETLLMSDKSTRNCKLLQIPQITMPTNSYIVLQLRRDFPAACNNQFLDLKFHLLAVIVFTGRWWRLPASLIVTLKKSPRYYFFTFFFLFLFLLSSFFNKNT